ncbi:NAD(P)H-dependent oxidoreductase subunit E [Lutimonas saemankumensis]|uniref:NADH-ubiquinone oxidoreductase-F iron-sulfur binding region domain-containing protein n=1 Tax=Lutimonas saemankumensis TaxID=483016 RepID=UPI001CD5D312|nr:NADH-ubiquinone oxidoreductase-F iron-sulfur binding region domain-containing protein [Lutimonas saemankumensis]MCA0932044.1 NAD(P)H-dependent oxidoreductase subunit E [Lutimonas saemankumensis]
MANKNIRSLSSRKGLDYNLFEKIAELSGNEAGEHEFQRLSKQFFIDDSVVFGTASFYDFIKPGETSKKVRICNGTACMVAGTQDRTKNILKSEFDEKDIGHVACVGHCHSNGAIMLNDQTYSLENNEHLKSILSLENQPGQSQNTYHVGANSTPILTAPVYEVNSFFKLAEKFIGNKELILNELKASNLRGRGGAGFPFWFKLDAVKKEDQSQKYIICNADEGDPGAYSDMYLMEQQPFKVLFGMYVSGICAGADTGVLYIRGEYPESIRSMENAIHYVKENNLIGNFRFKIIRGQGSYVCGEETALINSIEGLRPEVRVRPPYPAQYGLFGKPTVLSNVETFANIHWILDHGGKAFAALGQGASTGTKLVSLDSYFNRPGMYEIEMGTPLQVIFDEFGQGLKTKVKAFQIGGPLGGIVPANMIQELNLDFESLDQGGFLLGHASVVSIPDDYPMIKFMSHLLEFTAEESCGKCYPCRIGSYRGFEMLEKAQSEAYKIDKNLFDDLIETLEIGSLCALGGGVPLPLKNAMQYFQPELKSYFES